MIISNIDRLPKELEPNKALIGTLLEDLKELNRHSSKMLFIDYQDWHNEYSPERTDPCPDYYGCFRLLAENENLGVEMTLDELDSAICLISNYQRYAS